MNPEADRNPDGTPTDTNPSLTVADFGPAPIGVPNFVIDQFEIPPFLLPIYQACGTQYGIPWQVLASINQIETAFGTNLNVSTAGALGLDAVHPLDLGDVRRRRQRRRPQGPLQPGRRDLRRGPLPEGRRRRQGPPHARSSPTTTPTGTSTRSCSTRTSTASSPTTWSARSPASPRAPTSRSPPTPATPTTSPSAAALERSKPGKRAAGNAADVISGSTPHAEASTSTRATALRWSRSTTASIKKIGEIEEARQATSSSRTPTATATPTPQLGSIAEGLPGAEASSKLTAKDFKLVTPDDDAAPDEPAQRRRQVGSARRRSAAVRRRRPSDAGPVNTEDSRDRALRPPGAPAQRRAAPASPASSTRCSRRRCPATRPSRATSRDVFKFDPKTMELKPLQEGSQVTGGTVLGRIGKTDELAAAPQLRDPPGRPRRAEDRPEADPRRLEAARGHRDLPRRRQEPVRGRPRPSARSC